MRMDTETISYVLEGHELQNDVQTMIQVFLANRHYIRTDTVPDAAITVKSVMKEGIASAMIYRRGEKASAWSMEYDEKMLPVYKACMARDLPILFHMGDARSELSAPKKLANVLEKLPELKCIAAHLGGYQRWDEAKACLKGANVWVDTSSSLFVLNPDEARRSIEHFGMDKVMFGTDFPMWTHKKELERFFALGYGEEENRQMLYANFEKLLKMR